MKHSAHNGSTLFRRMSIPLLLVIGVLCLMFYAVTVYGGVEKTLNDSADDVFHERVVSKQLDISSSFTSQWKDLDTTVANLNQQYAAVKPDGGTSFGTDTEAQRRLIEQAYPGLVNTLRDSSATGVFLILNNAAEYTTPNDSTPKTNYGICIRDYDPTSHYEDKEDLLVSRCPSSMVSTIGCSIDSNWEATYTFNSEEDGDYFYKPLEQGYLHPDSSFDNLAYLSNTYNLGSSDRETIAYSVPLVDKTGYTYGVLGIELTVDYLKSYFTSEQLFGSSDSCYVLARYEEGSNTLDVITASGPLFQQAFGSSKTFSVQEDGGMDDGILHCENERNGLDLNASLADVPTYNSNTPFENDHLAVVGLVKNDSLYSVSHDVKTRLLMVSVLMLLLGLAAVAIVSKRVTKPITDLSEKVRSMDENSPADLDRLNISEIDDLVLSIENLSEKVNRNTVRSEFFSRMSHDMRTPMNAIIGFSSPEFMDNASPAQMREYLDKIHTSGTYLLGLINEVLDMTKIEFERMELRLGPVNAQSFWHDVDDMIGEVAKDKSVEFVETIDDSDCYFMADSQRLNQILMNLLSNAVKFTPEGGRVTYSVEKIASDDAQVTYRVVVSDTGIGMSRDFLRDMYEPFLQEDPGKGGTGLGLAISKQIIDLMHAKLDCVSAKGKGTTFTLTLTLDIAPQSEIQAVSSASAAPDGASEAQSDAQLVGKRILLCEDNAVNAQIAQTLLELKGMIVEHADNGSIGVSMFEGSSPGYYDAILMDIRMPVMNGLDAARAIRKVSRPDAKTIPIIAMTANAFAEDVENSREAGMNQHLSKPIDPSLLYLTLKQYI